MDRSQPDVRTEPSPDHADRHADAEGHERWTADRDRLLTIAGYAESLVEAVHRVDRAYEEAASVLAGARREAANIRSEAEREAEHMTARAREELARLEFQITRLESTRHLIAVPPVSPAPPAGPDVATPVDRPSERASDLPSPERHADSAVDVANSPSLAPASCADEEPAGDEPFADDVSAHVRSIRKLLEERADRRELEVVPPIRRKRVGAVVAIATIALALVATAWWVRGNRIGEVRLASARQGSPTREVGPRAAATPEPAPRVDAAAVPPQPEKVSVEIKAERATWIRTGSDGVLDRGRILAAGQQQVITGDREVEVRTGDGGAVVVSVNGGPETRMGKNGEDAVRRFAVADLARVSRASGPAPAPPKANDAVTGAERTSVATSGVADQPSAPARSARDEIADADARWFSARYTGAEAVLNGLQAKEFDLLDQRPLGEKPAPGLPVEREIRSLQVDTWADHAAASGVMVERVRGGNPRELMSIFAETWVKRDGRWQLMGLRITTPGGAPASR